MPCTCCRLGWALGLLEGLGGACPRAGVWGAVAEGPWGTLPSCPLLLSQGAAPAQQQGEAPRRRRAHKEVLVAVPLGKHPLQNR